jgi:hypothetical protein
MTFLNNHQNTTTVLPDFHYLTSSSDEQPFATTSHIPVYPISKSADVNQYITKNTNHVNKKISNK